MPRPEEPVQPGEIEADMRAEVDEEEALIAMRRLSDEQIFAVLARLFTTRKLYRAAEKFRGKDLPF